jgi:hypothetical protein
MVNISEYAKASSPYLKAKDVVDSKTKVFTIVSEATIVEKEFEGNKSMKLQVEGEMDGIEYKFDISKTNARVIEKALGIETSKWIGSQLILETYKTKNSKNLLVDAINIKEAKRIV